MNGTCESFALLKGAIAGNAASSVEIFETEAEARRALRRFRVSPIAQSHWAELVRIDGDAATVLAWCGRPSPPVSAEEALLQTTAILDWPARAA